MDPIQASTPAPADTARTAKAAQDFEAMALGQLLTPMFDTVDSAHGLFGGGEGEAAWKPMMVNEMARHIAQHGGIGLADPIMRSMLTLQEAAHAP